MFGAVAPACMPLMRRRRKIRWKWWKTKGGGSRRLRKRKNSSREVEEESMGEEESCEEPARKKTEEKIRKKVEEREEEERIEEMMRRKREQEEMRRRSAEDRKENERKKEQEKERAREQEREKAREKEVKENGLEIEGECEDRIGKIQKELKRIVEAVERENGGKISVTRGDQKAVRDAVFVIQNEMMEILKKQMRMERRIREKEEKIEKEKRNERRENVRRKTEERRGVVSEESDSEGWKEAKVRRRTRTYAEVSKSGQKIEGRVVVTGDEGWKTPPSKSREGERALVVSSKEERDARKLADALARSISPGDIGGAPQAVRRIRDGKLVIVPKDKEQQGKIVSKLKKIKELEIREARATDPLLIISGVVRGMTDDEIADRINKATGLRVNEGMKVVRRIGCGNPWKENIIVRTGIEGFKILVKKGKIEMDCTIHHVEEYLGLAMCYRCCRFGHIVKYCTEAEACHKCGAGHDGRDCRESNRNCVNCFRMFGRKEPHSARDMTCSAMREILARSRRNISYGR